MVFGAFSENTQCVTLDVVLFQKEPVLNVCFKIKSYGRTYCEFGSFSEIRTSNLSKSQLKLNDLRYTTVLLLKAGIVARQHPYYCATFVIYCVTCRRTPSSTNNQSESS